MIDNQKNPAVTHHDGYSIHYYLGGQVCGVNDKWSEAKIEVRRGAYYNELTFNSAYALRNATAMLDSVFEFGKRAARQEIRAALGIGPAWGGNGLVNADVPR